MMSPTWTALISTALIAWSGIAPACLAARITQDAGEISSRNYEYVIIGGGLSGLVLANRLSEDNKTTVLVVEAGGDGRYDDLINNPFNAVAVEQEASIDWNWNTVVQKTSGKALTILGGKVLGGSSSINGMDWTRGTEAQYNAIEALGNRGWNWKSLNSYMKKAETFYPPTAAQLAGGADYIHKAHGYSGPVGAGFPIPDRTTKLYSAFVSAAQAVLGIKKGADFCDGNPNIASQTANSLHPAPNGTASLRSSSAVSYLYPIVSGKVHSGLIVLTNHQVHRILWSKSQNSHGNVVATGVEFSSTSLGTAGPKYTVNLTREVIVSAGAIMTPQILQLSGIGNPSLLSKAGVKVAVNLPSVGTGLQDQALNLIIYSPSNATIYQGDFIGFGTVGAPAVAFPNIQQLLGKVRAKKAIHALRTSAGTRAQAIVNRGAWTNADGLRKIFKLQVDLIANGNTPVAEIALQVIAPVIAITPWLLLPQTRGSVKIASNDPFTYPLIDPAYLDDDFDVLIQTAAYKASRQMGKSSPFSATVAAEVVPGEQALPLNASDAAYTSLVKSSYQPVYHPIGTVAMMSKDIGGSVDSNLLIYGASNVRVVDASILPFQLSAHLSSTLYGVAEKAADIIIAARK